MRKNKSTILEAVHETAKGLHAAGVMDQVTLREFDRLCLPPIEPLRPKEIKAKEAKAHRGNFIGDVLGLCCGLPGCS